MRRIFPTQHPIAHTCIFALVMCLRIGFLHIILLVYVHLLIWKVSYVSSAHCYFFMVLLSCRKRGRQLAIPDNLERDDPNFRGTPGYLTHFFLAAYSTSRPSGTVIAKEAFSSGVFLPI